MVSLLSFNSFAACTTYWNASAYGDTQLDSIALLNLRGAPVAHVTTAHLRQLVDIKNRLTFAANVKAALWLCDDATPNASAWNISGLRLVVFNLGMLDFLQWNPDAVSAVMAHEVAHIALGHSPAARWEKTKATLASLSASTSGDRATSSSSAGIAPVQLSAPDLKSLLLFKKFSRDDELQADSEGIKLLTRVGINPEGALKAHSSFLDKMGDRGGGYLDSHPSQKERVKQSASYLATDSKAKQLVAQIQYEAASNEEYTDAAEAFIKSKSWKKLGVLTNQWLAHSYENALAFYYRGIYLSAGLNQKTQARKLFYKALELDPDNARARLELCVALFEEGQKLESTYCQRNIAKSEDKQAFKARTFGASLWVGGEIEPFTSVIVARNGSNSKYVTNLVDLAKRNGLAATNHFAE